MPSPAPGSAGQIAGCAIEAEDTCQKIGASGRSLVGLSN